MGRVAKFVKRVVALAAAAALAGPLAHALAIKDVKTKLVKEGKVDAYLVTGKYDPASIAAAAVDVALALVEAAKTPVEATGKVVIEKGVTYARAVPLYKETEKITLSETLKGGGINVLSDVLVFTKGTFEDVNGTEYTYTQELIPGDAVITFDDRPDTSGVADPTLFLDVRGHELYKIKVSFTKELPSTDNVKGQTIKLFGKEFVFDEIGSDYWILRDAAKIETLNIGGEIKFENKTIKLVDVVEESGGNLAAVVDVGGVQEKISKGYSKTVNGVDIYVADVYVSKTQQGVGYAKLFIGGKKLEIRQGSYVKYGDEEIKTAYAENVDKYGFIIKVTKSEEADKNILLPGDEFVDPVFGTFKLIFGKSDLKEGKYEVKLTASGMKVNLKLKDHRGNDVSADLWGDTDPSTQTTLDVGIVKEWKPTLDNVYGVGGTSTVSAALNTDYYFATSGDIHKVKITGITTSIVDADTYKVTVNYEVDGTAKTAEATKDVAAGGNYNVTVNLELETGVTTPLIVETSVTWDSTNNKITDVSTTGNQWFANVVEKPERLCVINRETGPYKIRVYTLTATGTEADKFIIYDESSKESYILYVISADSQKVVFKDYVTGDEYEVPLSASNGVYTGTLRIAGKNYQVKYEEPATGTKYVYLDGVSITTDNKLKLWLKGGALVTIGDTSLELDSPDDGTATDVAVSIGDGLIGSADNKYDLQITTAGKRTGENNMVYLLTDFGVYAEAKEVGDGSGYVSIYYPIEQVWYDVRVAPTNATATTETVEYKVGEEIPGVGKIKSVVAEGAYTIGEVKLTPEVDTVPGDKPAIVLGTTLGSEAVVTWLQKVGKTPEAGKALVAVVGEETPVVLVAGVKPEDVVKAAEWLAKVLKAEKPEEIAGADKEAVLLDVTGTEPEVIKE